jgi:hypothetical protein
MNLPGSKIIAGRGIEFFVFDNFPSFGTSLYTEYAGFVAYRPPFDKGSN